jgi:hypothetical protein
MSDEVDELALKAVRVLELVDHQEPEAKPHGVADLGVIPQKVARRKLEILEVDRRLAALRCCVFLREALQELL